MNGEIAAILAMDGIASGAIYVLIGLGLVLIFAVTRVIFVPFGDIAAFTALTLASLETGGLPRTVGLVAVLAVMFFGPEGVRTKPLTDAMFDVAGLIVSAQTLLIVAASAVFCGLLFLYFEFTIQGKALRATAVNRM